MKMKIQNYINIKMKILMKIKIVKCNMKAVKKTRITRRIRRWKLTSSSKKDKLRIEIAQMNNKMKIFKINSKILVNQNNLKINLIFTIKISKNFKNKSKWRLVNLKSSVTRSRNSTSNHWTKFLSFLKTLSLSKFNRKRLSKN